MKAILDQLKSEDAYALARARALITVYDETWRSKWDDYEILDVEREFQFPLLNPETETASRSFDEAGKIDVLARHKPTKRLVVIEHKTTSDSVAPDSDYWDRTRMDTQCSKYYLAAAQSGEEVGGILYDAIAKPGQRPSQIPTLDAQGFKIVLDFNGNRVMTKDGKKPRETADVAQGWTVQGRIETPEEFEARLLAVLRATPGDYFAQREVGRLDSDILEYMKDAWALSQQLLYARQHNLWPRNPQACKMMGTCEMFDLCCGRASVDGVRYVKSDLVHKELKIQGGDHQLLTNSRGNAYRKCARYHFLRYEQPVEKVQDEDANSALRFGQLVHAGLELYFLALKTKH
jgi:hypothetical protein